MTKLPTLDQFSRVVVKVGSSLLVDGARGVLKQDWLDALVADIASLHARGADVLVVSSGAIALGRHVAGLRKGALKLEDSQAAAAIGQIALARAWSQALHQRGILAGQVLLTLQDTEERRRYLNARETLARLLGDARGARSSTRTTPSPPAKSATATTTGSPRAWRRWRAPIC